MKVVDCGGVRLAVEESGQGTPLVLVHGAWTDRATWNAVAPALALNYRVIRYDRRGYGDSQRPGVRAEVHVADLGALLRTLGLGQVILVGNSIGAAIAIQTALASERVLSVMAHEPPFLCLLDGDARYAELARRRRAGVARALDAIRVGDHIGGARIFVESVTSAPGAWNALPEQLRREFIGNAAAFAAEGESLDGMVPDLSAMAGLGPRLVITHGERSSPYFRTIAENLLGALPRARGCVFTSAGHVPQQSHPIDFVAKTIGLIQQGA